MKGKWIFLQQIWGVLWGRLIYICERGKDGGVRFFLEQHALGDRLEEKNRESGKERWQPRPPRYVLRLFTYALSYSILEDPLTVLGVYFADWCGRKGPQIVVLKLNLCLFGVFFILLMSLIPSENKLHTCPSSDWMVEITPCFYSNLILNHSPILS